MGGPKILIVDDEEWVRELLRGHVERLGYRNLVEATDGEEAVRVAGQEHPEVILLDLLLPKRSGLDIIRELKEAHATAQIVIVSSLEDPKIVEQTTEAGAVGFISKPFHPAEIADVLERVLEERASAVEG